MTRPEFNQLIQQLSRTLYGFAFRILRSREEAEDVVQEIFIRLWKMGNKLDGIKSPVALATTMTKNYCIDIIRKRKHPQACDYNFSDYHVAASESPHEEMENRESAAILNMIIEDLPEAYRVVVKLRDIEGVSYEEIANTTDQNINTVRVTLSRARKVVRDKYNKYHYERGRSEKVDREVL